MTNFENIKASDLFVRALENEGVEYVFGLPGEENLDLLESLRTSSIELVLTRHEQGAGFMAATYGRLTGKPGVCLATLGPGATNLVTPTAYAQLGGMPLIVITGQKPIKSSKQGRFQILDIVRMMKPITKFAQQIVNVNNIPKGSRLAVSTNLLASMISLLMRVTGQTASLTGTLTEEERRLVAARAILGEWLGGSGGGWQDSGGIWPGIKLIKGVEASEGDPEYGK